MSERPLWPTPTTNQRPNEGNVRLLRARVLDGTLTEDEARAMLNGKSPLEGQGKLPPSAASSPGSEASTSASSGPAGADDGRSSTSPTASESSPSTGPMWPDMETSTTLTGPGSNPLTSLRAGSLVSPFPLRDDAELRTMIAGSGRSSNVPWLRFDRPTSSWKTSQASLALMEDSETYSGTWPRSGSMRSGTVFPRRPSVPRTSVIGSGSSPIGPNSDGLWPTPTTDSSMRSGVYSQGGMNLGMAVRAWPTPKASAANYGQPRENDRGDLQAEVIRRTWPTPSAADNRDRGNLSTPAIQRRARKGKQLMLSMVVSDVNGQLNPTWVEWLMGFPLGWTDLGPSATPSSRKSSSSSAGASSKRKRTP